jgi:hypothetical protein
VEHFRLSIKDGNLLLEKVPVGSGCSDAEKECPAPSQDYALPILAAAGGLAAGLAVGYLVGSGSKH